MDTYIPNYSSRNSVQALQLFSQSHCPKSDGMPKETLCSACQTGSREGQRVSLAGVWHFMIPHPAEASSRDNCDQHSKSPASQGSSQKGEGDKLILQTKRLRCHPFYEKFSNVILTRVLPSNQLNSPAQATKIHSRT